MRHRPPVSLFALLLAACAPDVGAPDPAAVGEVRGAPLRAPKGAEPEADASAQAEAENAALEEIALDYADVLPPEEAARYAWVDFLELSEFDLPAFELGELGTPAPELEEGSREGAPEEIVALHGQRVAVEGFMNPTAFDRGGVSEFTLVADPRFCCFGLTPALNHFIQVELPEGERTEYYSIVPIAVFGVLEVGLHHEEGIPLNFYRMRAEHVFCVY